MSATQGDGVPVQTPDPVPGPGARLRAAREARGLTLADVAAALKMSPRQIDAMEAEEFCRLSGATFVRGFMRNYAKLLGIDAAPLLAALADRTDLPCSQLTPLGGSGVRMPSAADGRGKGALAAALAALAMLGVAFALYFDLVNPAAYFGQRTEHPPLALKMHAGEAPVAQPANAAGPAAEVELVAQPAVAAAAVSRRPGEHQLVFSFDADAWVEVKDAAGRIMISQLNRKGTTQVVAGQAPFQLVIGNAGQVRLQYEEQPVDLKPHTRVEVARLTLP